MMPLAMTQLTAVQRDDLIAELACERQQPRKEIKAAAISLGAVTLSGGRKLIADSTRWWLGTPVEAR